MGEKSSSTEKHTVGASGGIKASCVKFANDMATGKAHSKISKTGESSNDGGGFQY